MKMYCHANSISNESNAIRCFLSYEDAQSFSPENIVFFEAELADACVYEGAYQYYNYDKFEKSKLTLDKYSMGMFLRPVYFAVNKSKEYFSADEKDSVKLFESDDKFYTECLFQKLSEKYPSFELYAVRSCLETLCASGKMKKTDVGDLLIFEDSESGELIPICKKYNK